MNFSRFRRGFTIMLFNYTQWLKGDLFCLGNGYQTQTSNGGQDQVLLVCNPITWSYDDNLQKHVLSWLDSNGKKVISTSGELYDQEIAYDEYVSQVYG